MTTRQAIPPAQAASPQSLDAWFWAAAQAANALERRRRIIQGRGDRADTAAVPSPAYAQQGPPGLPPTPGPAAGAGLRPGGWGPPGIPPTPTPKPRPILDPPPGAIPRPRDFVFTTPRPRSPVRVLIWAKKRPFSPGMGPPGSAHVATAYPGSFSAYYVTLPAGSLVNTW